MLSPAYKYQEEIIQHFRKHGRTICCLPTGSGKTRIAWEAIKHVLSDQMAQRVLFLAPTVALLLQQCNVFRTYCEVEGKKWAVREFFGCGDVIPQQALQMTLEQFEALLAKQDYLARAQAEDLSR